MRENGARVTGEQATAVLIREKRGRPSDSIRRLGSGRILVGRVAAREGREVLAGRGLLLVLGFLGRASARVGRARRHSADRAGPHAKKGPRAKFAVWAAKFADFVHTCIFIQF